MAFNYYVLSLFRIAKLYRLTTPYRWQTLLGRKMTHCIVLQIYLCPVKFTSYLQLLLSQRKNDFMPALEREWKQVINGKSEVAEIGLEIVYCFKKG